MKRERFGDKIGRHNPDVRGVHDCAQAGCFTCAACEFEFDSLEKLAWCDPPIGRDEGSNYCFFCFNTFSGTAADHPGSHPGDVLAAICFVGNVVLEELKRSELPRE